jgi:hypothetical protein
VGGSARMNMWLNKTALKEIAGRLLAGDDQS